MTLLLRCRVPRYRGDQIVHGSRQRVSKDLILLDLFPECVATNTLVVGIEGGMRLFGVGDDLSIQRDGDQDIGQQANLRICSTLRLPDRL